MLIRVQSPDGTKRIEIQQDSINALYDKVTKEFALQAPNEWGLFLDHNRNKLLPKSRSKNVNSILRHGDLIYLLKSTDVNIASSPATETQVDEDEVDRVLAKMDGRIQRERDEQLCHHGPQARCMNCTSIEPFDLEYLRNHEPPIKYMSFHSYIRKLQSGVDKGKYVNLEDLVCKIKPGCTIHPPWPKGICNKCQPNTVYLNRQPYRHVDNIMFENPQIVEGFLNYWRKSGHQRVGFLFGRYEVHDGVPLGIRATVSAIYEPPQETSESHVRLIMPDPNEAKINNMAKKMGLSRIGWIFTDLVTDDIRKGTVKNFRGNTDSHFLSAEECIMAGYFQNMYKNPCKLSPNNYFGSKFVTVVVTGDSNNQIHFEGYQVSNQCMALVRDSCIVPTYDVPRLAYIKESTNEQFVPDVYYREKDSYNNEITKIARPLPVEYLIVDLPAAFPRESYYTFNENSSYLKTQFPIENRNIIHEVQDFGTLSTYMKQFPAYRFIDAITNFHVLMYLATNQTVSFENVFDTLLKAISEKDARAANEWKETPEWLTVEHFFQLNHETLSHEMMDTDTWSCKMCTFNNPSNLKTCSICQTARN